MTFGSSWAHSMHGAAQGSVCPQCGSTKTGSLFCKSCGATLRQPTPLIPSHPSTFKHPAIVDGRKRTTYQKALQISFVVGVSLEFLVAALIPDHAVTKLFFAVTMALQAALVTLIFIIVIETLRHPQQGEAPNDFDLFDILDDHTSGGHHSAHNHGCHSPAGHHGSGIGHGCGHFFGGGHH